MFLWCPFWEVKLPPDPLGHGFLIVFSHRAQVLQTYGSQCRFRPHGSHQSTENHAVTQPATRRTYESPRSPAASKALVPEKLELEVLDATIYTYMYTLYIYIHVYTFTYT